MRTLCFPNVERKHCTTSAVWLVLMLPVSLLAQQGPQEQPDRIQGSIDATHLIALKGNIHPKARPENDRGRVSPDLNLDYITLHLKPTQGQQAELNKLLIELQTPTSPLYHNWLTPEAYADRFGASNADIAQIVGWLENQGLTVISAARGRNFVVFKGSAAKVQAALHIEIHTFLVEGEMHYANSTQPSVPASIEAFTIGFSGLDDFKQKPQGIFHGQYDLSGGDLSTIYDTAPLYKAGATGSGMKLAVIGQSDVNLADVALYQAAVGLPPNPPIKILVPGSTNPGIVSGDSGESDADLELTGATAPNAQILFVYSTNVLNSVGYAIDQALAPVISYSYAACELNVAKALVQAFEQAAQQSSTEGITWVASSGDTGAAACDPHGASIASQGISVMLPASVPEVTGVGGTEFNEGGGAYWGGTSNPFALSYVPEIAWNDTKVTNQLEASGGGASINFSRPSWQSAPGVPSGTARLVPDVAMAASPNHDGYFVVQGGNPVIFGGTSAAAPAFAGIVLLMAQALGAGLGNINPSLYSLASEPARVCNTNSPTAACIFHDIVSGNNIVPCLAGVTGCTGGFMGYTAGPGYDMVTGLGSVDASRFVLAFGSLTSGPTIFSVSTAFGGAGIAQNTYIVIKGANLVPLSTSANGAIWSSAPSFASGQMPTQLGNVSVKVNNKPAFVYFYCSAATDPGCVVDQLNVLTPLDTTTGPVSIVVTNGSASTPAFTANMQTVAPSFLLFSAAGYVAATHVNGSLLGPASLFPGYTTPASRGETIVLYAVGFGLPSTAITNGSATQSGSLPTLPVCTIGGNTATVGFAGLIAPGLYQLNLTVPASVPSGDNLISCSYGGFSTPTGDLIAVQ
jgi:uncharacterized protein (TIGR03437 family)